MTTPGTAVATRSSDPPPRTVYTLRRVPSPDEEPATGTPNRGAWRRNLNARTEQFVRKYSPDQPASGGLSGLFQHDGVIVAAWIGALAVITVDEWYSYGILPRPSRLWWATLVYGSLAVIGISDTLLPFVNVLAVGYTIVLAWQYFNKQGQFSGSTTSATLI